MMKQIVTTAVLILSFSSSVVMAAEAADVTGSTRIAPLASEETALASADVVATTGAAKLAEDQIPLSIETTKKATESGSTGTKAMMSMFIVLILTGTGYYLVRRYKFSNTINKSNTQIKVLSQHYLGPKKSLAIIHVAGESILIGVTDQNISMIKSLSLIDDEVPAELPNNFGQTLAGTDARSERAVANTARAAIADRNLNSNATSATRVTEESLETAPAALDEEFSFTNVTENVSKKLRSMRSFS